MRRLILAMICLLALACFGRDIRRSEPARPADLSPQEIEAYLRNAPIVSIKKDATTGRTTPWKITLDDGRTKLEGMFKRIDVPRPDPAVDSYKYELAAYELCRLLDLDLMPPTVEREIEGTKGSLQYFIPNCMSELDRERLRLQPPDLKAFLDRLDEIKVFEALAKDTCLDKDDTLVQKNTWKVYRVDFAEAFAPSQGLAADCPINRCSRHLFGHLQKIARQTIEARLKPYLSDDDINALNERKKKIVARLDGLITSEGEGAVLY